jgi:UrcA family protein
MSIFITARAAGPRAKVALLALGALAGVMAAGLSSAASPDRDVPSIVIHYSQSSLATDTGVNELYRRIVQAAKNVCPVPSNRDLVGLRLAEECRNQAVARAIGQIDNSQLAALYASHTKNS